VVEVETVDQEGGPIHSVRLFGTKKKPPDRNPEGASEFFRTQLASMLLLYVLGQLTSTLQPFRDFRKFRAGGRTWALWGVLTLFSK
jgi:hypothetical protein